MGAKDKITRQRVLKPLVTEKAEGIAGQITEIQSPPAASGRFQRNEGST